MGTLRRRVHEIVEASRPNDLVSRAFHFLIFSVIISNVVALVIDTIPAVHNVAGGIGVLDGNGGLLRAGLPLQSIHDGERFVHEPLRLAVFVEAPTDAITAILRRHDGVRSLFEITRLDSVFNIRATEQEALA